MTSSLTSIEVAQISAVTARRKAAFSKGRNDMNTTFELVIVCRMMMLNGGPAWIEGRFGTRATLWSAMTAYFGKKFEMHHGGD
jgi:hypothetical protein